MKVEFRKFREDDWYGFAGSEEFENGESPLICYTDEWAIILDQYGIGVMGNKEDTTEEIYTWSVPENFPWIPEVAIMIFQEMIKHPDWLSKYFFKY